MRANLLAPPGAVASWLTYPNVLIDLATPTEVALPFKPARQVTTIGLHPDDAAVFVEALAEAQHHWSGGGSP